MSIIIYLLGLLLLMVANLWLVVRLFQVKGALHGILGFFCGIYTLIWSLMNMSTHNLKKPLLILLAGVVVTVIGAVMAGPEIMKLQEQQQQQGLPAPVMQPQ
jgi:uncharacterized membrane protein